MNKIVLKILFIGIVINLNGCSRPLAQPTISPQLIDKSAFTGIPCAAPCWYSLEIGKSSESDVMLVLSNLDFIDQKNIQVRPMLMPDLNPNNWVPGKIITANCISPRKLCLSVDIANGKLRGIEIILNYKMKLEEVLGYLGNPDKVGINHLSHDLLKCEIEFIWIEKQLLMSSKTYSGDDGCNYSFSTYTTGIVDSNLEIVAIKYLLVEEIDLMVLNKDRFGIFNGVKP